MTFNEYQKQAITTKIYKTEDALAYVTLGIAGEAGEVAEKVKKIIRDDDSIVSGQKRVEISKELGDVLWYIAAMCEELGLDFNKVAEENIQKLQSRKDRGQLTGSGDNR